MIHRIETHPDKHHQHTARCECGWTQPGYPTKEQADQAGETHMEETRDRLRGISSTL